MTYRKSLLASRLRELADELKGPGHWTREEAEEVEALLREAADDLEARTEIAASELTVSVPEAAQMLGISRTYAFQLAREGRLPGAFRIGGRVLVSRQVLERLLAGGGDD